MSTICQHDLCTTSFCPHCGMELKAYMSRYVGIPIESGLYRITFEPIEAEFETRDRAADAARSAAWDEDRDFTGYEIEKLESTAEPEQYPYVCTGCRVFVHDDATGTCDNCGNEEWERRAKDA